MVRIEAGQPPRWTFPDKEGLELPLPAIAWSVADSSSSCHDHPRPVTRELRRHRRQEVVLPAAVYRA
jgi:hypothetical protein